MIPQLLPEAKREAARKAEIYNRYLKHANVNELKRLIEEATICLNLNPETSTVLDSGIKTGFYSNIFESRLFIDNRGGISEWNGTIGRPPTKVLNSDFAQYRKVEFSVKKPTLDNCCATGFKKYKKSEKTKQLLSIIGLLLVCFGQGINEFIYISQLRRPSLTALIDEVILEFGVIIESVDDKIYLKSMGEFLSNDPIPYLKVAFPTGVVVRHGIPYQIY